MSIINTIRFNFRYFMPKVALKFPVLVGKNVARISLHGDVYMDLPEDEIKTGMIKIGFSNLGIVDYSKERLLFENSGKIYFKGKADIGTGSRISNSGTLIFGENFQSSGKMTVICTKQIIFGNDNLISWHTLFMDSDLHIITDNRGGVCNQSESIELGSHVWVGCNVTVLKKTRIADNTVIAAGSVIAGKSTTNNCVIGSNGKILRKTINWKH